MNEAPIDNFRVVDDRFRLSGGWVDVPRQAAWLAENGVVAVLDLQFEPDWADTPARWANSLQPLIGVLSDHGIEHRALPMFDGENDDLAAVYEAGADAIRGWIERYPDGRILVKCLAGMSRSVSMLTYWLCASGTSLPDALQTIGDAGGRVALSSVLRDFLEDRFGYLPGEPAAALA
jgi:hypothetical protein